MFPVGLSFPGQFTTIFFKGSQIVSKMIELTRQHFKILESVGLTGMGSKEIAFNATVGSKSQKIYFLAHGALFIASGLTSALIAANQYQFIQISKWVQLLSLTGNGLFLAANLLALYQNIESYKNALKLETSGLIQDLEKARHMKYSAVLGIMNSLGYLMVPIATLFHAPLAFAIIFGCIAVSTGCLKILYDFYYRPVI